MSVKNIGSKLRQFFSIIVISFLLGACAPAVNEVSVTPTQLMPTATQPDPTATQRVCQPSKILTSPNSFPEIQGTMYSDGELWALLFFDKAVVNEEEKIVWRITGTGGRLTVQAHHDDGTVVDPVWGPEYHDSSTWKRPGVEWGTGFKFPKPGCWILTVSYGSTIGEVGLDVSDK